MINLPSKVKIVEKKDDWARFEIEALYPGYGVTIANSLRRVLLSSLAGAAITQVKIKGVSHEFSTIPGVFEDVISILMNLKKLRFKLFSEEPQRAELNIKGQKKVKASDFKLPAQLELVNKDAYIATLTSRNASLEMEIQVERGLGYEPKERRKKEKLEIGMIALDAIFTPIRKVSYNIENVRVGERTDFDRLFLDIETDGTISPEQALAQASQILAQHFSLFAEKTKTEVRKEEKKEKELSKKTKVKDLALPAAVINTLLKNNIKTVAGILAKKKETLANLKGIGPKALKEVEKAVLDLGFELKE